MPLVQIRDVPEETLHALEAKAAARGLSLAVYLRAELYRLAPKPSPRSAGSAGRLDGSGTVFGPAE